MERASAGKPPAGKLPLGQAEERDLERAFEGSPSRFGDDQRSRSRERPLDEPDRHEGREPAGNARPFKPAYRCGESLLVKIGKRHDPVRRFAAASN